MHPLDPPWAQGRQTPARKQWVLRGWGRGLGGRPGGGSRVSSFVTSRGPGDCDLPSPELQTPAESR